MKADTATQMEINGESQAVGAEPQLEAPQTLPAKKQALLCDRCGFEMYEANCKVICPNCGNRYDCSDLTIYFD